MKKLSEELGKDLDSFREAVSSRMYVSMKYEVMQIKKEHELKDKSNTGLFDEILERMAQKYLRIIKEDSEWAKESFKRPLKFV